MFLPQILILFFFILVLEDTGYLPRAAFLLDRVMGMVGLSGRSFIPLLSSFACAVPGIMATRLTGRIDRGIGDEVLGKVDGIWVVEWSFLPDDYGIVVARGSSTPVLGMRQYPAPELQGLFTENHSPDGNLLARRFIRYAGFGVWNRVGAIAWRVSNGAYAIPTGYTTPLAV